MTVPARISVCDMEDRDSNSSEINEEATISYEVEIEL